MFALSEILMLVRVLFDTFGKITQKTYDAEGKISRKTQGQKFTQSL
jgi:YD repeat-containing protein